MKALIIDRVSPLVESGLKEYGVDVDVKILPGVDGLIHISQIADHRIAKPEDALEVGQVVEAKIIDINDEKKKVSLSIRALLEDGEDYED